jgi:hypothetical protein
MDSGIRKKEKWTLYDEQNRPVEVDVLVLVFSGVQEVTHFQSGRTPDGRKLKPRGVGVYETDDGKTLTVLPTAD